MFHKLKCFVKNSPVNIIPLIIMVLLLSAAMNIYVTRASTERLVEYREETVQRHNVHKWNDIELLINMANTASRQNSKFIASRIEADLLREYSDLDDLRVQFERGNFSKTFHNVLKENLMLDNGAPSAIYQPSYYTLVGLNDGIISLFSNEDSVALNAESSKETLEWHTYAGGFPNEQLATTAIDAVLQKSRGLIFWQNYRSDNVDLNGVSDMSMKTLQQAYDKYGLEGLRNYSLLSPSYITDNGDIFNTDDTTFMKKNKNYKLVIIQSFNLSEIIDQYDATLALTDANKMYAETFLDNYIQQRYIESALWSFALFLLSMVLTVLYNSEQKRIESLTIKKSEGDKGKEKK